jgi:ectoine hydroxylase-related dioxygenase (phytanoyl-CoA dioxygenase family)
MAVLGQTLGPDYLLSDYSLNTVHPRQPVDEWHVDYPYNVMATMLVEPFLGLQCILALDRFDTHNGATQYVLGSHLDLDPPSVHPPEHTTFAAEPGDLLIMAARTSHRSGFNDSTASRTAMLFSFVQRWVRPMSHPHGPSPWAVDSRLRVMLGLDLPAGTPYQSPDRI